VQRNDSTIALVFTFLAMATSAAAQGQWEVEFHAGGMLSSQPKDGTATLPAAGTPFTSVTNVPSRRESSWFFGDGAVLLNQVNAARGASARITALDPVLTTAVVGRQNAGSFGIRISRHMSPRYTAEFAMDYSRAQLTMNDDALAGIEASRASFTSAFNVPNTPGSSGFAPVVSVTSTNTIDNQGGHQVFTAGVLAINLRSSGKMMPYATVGAGVLFNSGDTPSAILSGNYRMTSPPGSPNAGTVPHNETDTVNVRYSIERRAFAGIGGGGIKYAITSRWGVRLDIRAHVTRNRISTLVDANPSVVTVTPGSVLVFAANPTVQLSGNPSIAQSSLSGAPIQGFQTFRGGGTQVQVSIVPGFFWRF
jgi:hypothetical protein